jgi:hypothetical protein
MQHQLTPIPADSGQEPVAADLAAARYQAFRRVLFSRLCEGLASGRMENCRGLLQALVMYPPTAQP